jgi:hypothetical protein
VLLLDQLLLLQELLLFLLFCDFCSSPTIPHAIQVLQ